MYKEYPPGQAPAVLEELAAIFRSADGFAIVSGEYNHGIPPALKNLLDHFLEEYFWRPAAIVCYSGGRFGGVRAAMQLRMTLAEMGMVTIPSLFPIPHVQNAFDDDGTPAQAYTGESFEGVSRRSSSGTRTRCARLAAAAYRNRSAAQRKHARIWI